MKHSKSPALAREIFVSGGSLSHDSPVYVARETDREASRTVLSKKYLTVIAPRQMGKTSLLHKLKYAMEQELNFAVAMLDLSKFNSPDVSWTDWSKQVCSDISSQLGKRSEDELNVDLPDSPARFPNFLTALAHQIDAPTTLILFDEAASVPDTIRDPFYSVIRSMYNDRLSDPHMGRYNFVFAGVFEPERLVKNRINSPFNISEIVQLRDFTIEETSTLLGNLKQIRSVSISEAFVNAVHNWTGGQPYLTQRLATIIGEQLEEQENLVLNSDLVSSLIPKLMTAARDNVDDVTKRATDPEKGYREWMWRVLNGDTIQFTRAISQLAQLELIGAITVQHDGKVAVRNQVYKRAMMPAFQFEDGVSSRAEPINLRLILCERFSKSELRTLIYELGIDYDGLPGDSKADKTRELIEYLERRHSIGKLIEYIQLNRRDIQL